MKRYSDQYKDELFNEVMARAESKPAKIRHLQGGTALEKDRQKKKSLWYKVAAVLALAVLSSLPLYYMWQQGSSQETTQALTYATSGRQRSTITLADGSTVQLNTNSQLICPPAFNGDTREVTLRGEAFFTIIRDTNKPFLVKTAHLTTQVLGTSFNIKAFPEQPTAVTVASGKVKVSPLEGASTDPDGSRAPIKAEGQEPPPMSSASTLVLTQAEQALFDPQTGTLKKKQVNAERFLAWKDGTLLFEKNNFSEVAEILEQWYGIQVTVENPQLDQCSVSGKFMEHPTLHKVLDGLQFIYKIEYEFDGEEVRIMGNGCN